MAESERPRLVVEIGDESEIALRACMVDEGLNKSTLLNKAIQLYASLAAIRRAGGEVYIRMPDSRELERFRWE